jgi:hypothetical protein
MAHAPLSVRHVGQRPTADAEWSEVLDAVRRWRSYGAPYRAIADMLASDYGIELDDGAMRRLLNIADSVEFPLA